MKYLIEQLDNIIESKSEKKGEDFGSEINDIFGSMLSSVFSKVKNIKFKKSRTKKETWDAHFDSPVKDHKKGIVSRIEGIKGVLGGGNAKVKKFKGGGVTITGSMRGYKYVVRIGEFKDKGVYRVAVSVDASGLK